MATVDDILYRNEKGSALTFAELDDNFYKLALAIDNIQVANNSTVVVRDSSGNFSANTITANLAGNSATTTKFLTARTINGVSFDGTANITLTANTTQTLTRGTYLTGSNFNGGTATTWAVDATNLATASKVVARDASGNFSANTITAALTGAASSNVLKAGDTMTGKLNTAGDDSARLIESLNTSALGSPAQFYVEHNLGATNVGNARGVLNLVSTGALTIGGSVALTASNFNTYAPTLTGTGASGTWGISITGNAGTATTLQTARTIGDVSFNGSANIIPERIYLKDTRAVNFAPYTYPGVTLHLKDNTTDGLSDGVSYHGVLNLQHWTDASGGRNHQLGFTDNGNIHHRSSSNTTTWTSWSRLYDTGDASTSATANTLVLRDANGNFSANTLTVNTITGTISNATTLDGNAETAYLRFRGTITETTLNDTTTDADRTSGFYRVSYPGASDSLLDIGGMSGSTPRVQFRFNYNDSIWFRAARDTATNWDSVTSRGVLLLHSSNYNSYAPTLTGTGASGTWGISVTGNAATVTNGVYTTGDQSIAGIKTFTGSIDSAATFSAFGSSTALTLGYNSTASSTTSISGAAAASGSVKTINIGTSSASGSATNITLGSAVAGSFGNTVIQTPSVIVPGNLGVGATFLPTTGPITNLSTIPATGGSGYMNGTHTNVTLSGGTGNYVLATVVVAAGVVTSITYTWGGHRYSVGDVLTVPSLATTLATTAASGDGVTATLTFAAQAAAPFEVGSQIVVTGVTPTGYNGTFTVTACTTTTVSYANATTGAQTVAGTVKMGTPLTNATTAAVGAVQGADVYVSSYTSDAIGARIRLETNDTTLAASQELGAIIFASRDSTAQASGDVAMIRVLANGTSGGTSFNFLTAPNASAPAVAATLSSAGDFTAVGNVTAYSDERLKSNIRTVDNALDKVTAMRGVYFDKDGRASVGVIAQEMEVIVPEVVIDGDYKSVAYGNLVGVLIEAIKELKAEIDELKRGK